MQILQCVHENICMCFCLCLCFLAVEKDEVNEEKVKVIWGNVGIYLVSVSSRIFSDQ